MHVPTLRVARATRDIARLVPFYRDGLGLHVIGSFRDHEGFDGIMFGVPGAPYHLEFTHHASTQPAHPHPDDVLVLYITERGEWLDAIRRMEQTGFSSVSSANPYWDRAGRTFEHPDGHRIVLENSRWAP